ncbi:MAG: hypothetical protein KBT29_02795 [Prevotellaceae bacterium]|nr:hypothetical protein [Candidatus Minthosoma caballi]
MKKRIVLSPDFLDELEELLDALVEGEYFSSLEWALKYTEAIERFINDSIGVYPAKKVPFSLRKHGSLFIKYKHSQHTTWYIVFDELEDAYFIKHITNNHVSGQYFNY